MTVRTSAVLVLIASGCTEVPYEGEHAWSTGPELAPTELNPELDHLPRATLILTVDQVIPGDLTTVTVSGASSSETVYLARTLTGLGSGPCLGTLGGLCLDIADPVVEHSNFVTDAAGVGVFQQVVPESLPIGLDVWLQALVPRGQTGFSWVKSHPLQVTTANPPLVTSGMVAGDLVITEVMNNPLAVADAAGEWFEVYNASGLDANLNGLRITNGVSSSTITENVFLGAGERKVFGANSDLATNGGAVVHWQYGAMDLLDTWGEIYLMVGPTVIDGVAWDDGTAYPLAEGVAMNLVPGSDHVANDLSANWCGARSTYGDGDAGTPGITNSSCFGGWFDDFDTGAVDPAVFASVSGDAGVQSTYSHSPSHALNLGGSTGQVRTVTGDTSTCSSLSWSYRGKRGPEQPDAGEDMNLRYENSSGGWVTAHTLAGGTADGTFTLYSGTITSGSALHPTFRMEFRTTAGGTSIDDFFVDDFSLVCNP